MRGGEANRRCAWTNRFKSISGPFYNNSIDPSRLVNSRNGDTHEDGAGQGPDNKGKSTVRAGPPTSAFHNTDLRTADGGVPQLIVEKPESDVARAGKEKGSNTQPDVIIARHVPDPSPSLSPVEWPKETTTTSVLRAKSSHAQGPSTPVSPIDWPISPVGWVRSIGARTGRDRRRGFYEVNDWC